MLGLGLSLPGLSLRRGGGWSPAQLFANGEPGAFYDPSDLTTMFQDSAGTIPVTASGQPVGLALDKRLWGGKTLTQVLAGQPELNDDPDWSDWTLEAGAVVDDTDVVLTTADATDVRVYRAFTGLTVGATYHLYVGFSSYPIGAALVRIGPVVGSGTALQKAAVFPIQDYEANFVASATTMYVTLYNYKDAPGEVVRITGTSVKHLPGNHAVQATTASRPTYKTDGTLHWIEGDGVDDFLRSTFTISQPWERVSAIRQLSWTQYDRIFGGSDSTAGGILWQVGSSPSLGFFDGAIAVSDNAAAIGQDVIATERHSGASSRLAIDAGSYNLGNSGTTVPKGVTVFASNAGASVGNARCYGLIMRQGTMTDDQIAKARTFMAAKQGRVL